jgi:hypothetical protein
MAERFAARHRQTAFTGILAYQKGFPVGLFPQCPDLLQLLRAYHELLVKLDARLVGLIPAEYPGLAR